MLMRKKIEKNISNQLHSKQYLFDPFQSSVAVHMETSRLICTANQMDGFCLRRNTGLMS